MAYSTIYLDTKGKSTPNSSADRLNEVALFLLAAFFLVNIFDKIPIIGIPLDFFLLGVVVFLTILTLLLRKRIYVSIRVFSIFILLLVPALLINLHDNGKLARLLLYMLFFVLVTPNLFSSTKNNLVFCKFLSFLGVIASLISLLFNEVQMDGRLVLFGSNPIWLSRFVSFTIVWAYVQLLNKKINIQKFLAIIIFPAIVMLRTLSLGPLLALIIVTIVLSFQLLNKQNTVRFLKVTLIGLLLSIVLFLSLSDYQLSRIVGNEESIKSRTQRLVLISESLSIIKEKPNGVGLGQFSKYSKLPHLAYPHNVVLEVTAELGWLMGIALMYLIIDMYRVLHLKSKQNSDYMGIYSLTLLAIINSMVSRIC